MAVPDGYQQAVAADWETYSPMSEAQIRDLLDLVSHHDGREVTDSAVSGWGVESATGNWDKEGAARAVEAYFAKPRQGGPLGPAFVTGRITAIRQASRFSGDFAGRDTLHWATSTDSRFLAFFLTVVGLATITHVPWVLMAVRLPAPVLLLLVLPVELSLWAFALFGAKRIFSPLTRGAREED